MPPTVTLPWGSQSLQIEVPKSWKILGELSPQSTPIQSDPAEACAVALKEPIGTRPLRDRNLEGKRVVIITDDHSRPTPVAEFISPVLDELAQAGVDKKSVEILIACGVHRASRPEEAAQKLGTPVATEYSWQCHDAYNQAGLAELGVTKRGTKVSLNKMLTTADLIVCLGATEPHLLLGFGGGLKMIIPGCASAETIATNHMQGVTPEKFDYVGTDSEDSPMRLDLEEGAGLLKKDIFIVNAAMNEQARPTAFFCGDPIRAHRAAVDFIRKLAQIDVPEQADVVLANSYPMDLDLRQSMKCVGNSLYAAKEGGVLLGCLKCNEGLGEMPLAAKTLPYTAMRTLLRVIGKNRILPLVKKVKKNEPEEEVFIGNFGMQMLRRNHLGLFSDSDKLPKNIGRKLGLARSFTAPEDMIAWAASKAPKNATLWVFPNGGVSYAQA